MVGLPERPPAVESEAGGFEGRTGVTTDGVPPVATVEAGGFGRATVRGGMTEEGTPPGPSVTRGEVPVAGAETGSERPGDPGAPEAVDEADGSDPLAGELVAPAASGSAIRGAVPVAGVDEGVVADEVGAVVGDDGELMVIDPGLRVAAESLGFTAEGVAGFAGERVT